MRQYIHALVGLAIYMRRSASDGCGVLLTVDFGGSDYWILLYLLMLIIRVQTFRFQIRRNAKVPEMVNKTTDIQQASAFKACMQPQNGGCNILTKIDD
jgi:hypothetical protein